MMAGFNYILPRIIPDPEPQRKCRLYKHFVFLKELQNRKQIYGRGRYFFYNNIVRIKYV